jgi:putative phosphoribosyl transferase
MFRDRHEAGRMLAAELVKLPMTRPIVLALPRGGVPVGAEIARALKAPLDVVVVRKVGAPGNPELAVAAIVGGDPPDVVFNDDIVDAYALDSAALRILIDAERPELQRRARAYGSGRPPLPVAGRTAILVDDGVATGATMKAAIRALKRRAPCEIVLAIPVAPPETVGELAVEADRVVCLNQPASFLALGYYYRSFPQLEDNEVVALLEASREEWEARGNAVDGGDR